MADHITLLGAEDVLRAARNMQSAAEDMQRVAASIEDSVQRFARILAEHAERIEAAMASDQD